MKSVSINPEVKNGVPVVAKTRIPVKSVIYLYKKLKKTPEIIALHHYTQLSIDQIRGVIKWWEQNQGKYGRVDF